MLIFVLYPTGRKLSLDVEKNDLVNATKSRIEDKEGIPVNMIKLVYYGQVMNSHFKYPRLKKNESRFHFCFENGVNSTKVLFLNELNTLMTLKIPSHTSELSYEGGEEYFDRFFEQVEELIVPKLSIPHRGIGEYCFRLFCGDEEVCSKSYNPAEVASFMQDGAVLTYRRNLVYYFPRNDLWSFSMAYATEEASLEDYNVEKERIVRCFIKSDKGIALHPRPEYSSFFCSKQIRIFYSEGGYPTSDEPFGLEDGINLYGACKNEDCEKFSKFRLYSFSYELYQSSNRRETHWPYEKIDDHCSYDFDLDSSKFKCKKCNGSIRPSKCFFQQCYWRYTSIIDDPIKGRKIRNCGDWDRIKTSFSTFDCEEFEGENAKNVSRLQVEVRFYGTYKESSYINGFFGHEYDKESYFGNESELEIIHEVHPDQSYCCLCQMPHGKLIFVEGVCKLHKFHVDCLKKWGREGRSCLVCVERRKMEVVDTTEILDEKERNLFVLEYMHVHEIGKDVIEFRIRVEKMRVWKSILLL